MSRKIKNIISLILIIILGVSIYFTINFAKDNIESTNTNMIQKNGETPPEVPSNKNDNEMPPEIPSNESSSETPLEMPSSGNGSEVPPGMPNEENSNMISPDTNVVSMNQSNNNLDIIFYVLFTIESLGMSIVIIYLIMSNLNKKGIKETFINLDKITIFILSIIILTSVLTIINVYSTKNIFISNAQGNGSINNGNMDSNNNVSLSASASNEIDGTEETLNETYESSNSDESVILVKNAGELSLENATVNKNAGDSSNTENSEFYGINSGVLVTSNSTATITNSKITTNAKGSNAIFSTGTDSKIYISDSTITTTGSSSARGLDATYGGYIEADNVTIKTQGGSCATLATDRGEGTVIANNSNLETNGSSSPIIYSTGNISIDNTEGLANGSQMVVIEGKNSATVTNSTLKATGKGNRGDVDQAGIMIYQSMSGDASVGTGDFTAKDSSLNIVSTSDYYNTAPMFFITNTDAIINLENTTLSYGSNILISAKGTSEWGKSNSNGGNLTFNATNEKLDGNIEIDSISTLTLNLKSSSYKGIINENNEAKSVVLKLDNNSEITLMGDSYITELEDKDTTYSNINFNGYKLYVNGKSIN